MDSLRYYHNCYTPNPTSIEENVFIAPYVPSHTMNEILNELLKETIYYYGNDDKDLLEDTWVQMVSYYLDGKTGLIHAVH